MKVNVLFVLRPMLMIFACFNLNTASTATACLSFNLSVHTVMVCLKPNDYIICLVYLDAFLAKIPKSPVRELLEMEPETAKFE